MSSDLHYKYDGDVLTSPERSHSAYGDAGGRENASVNKSNTVFTSSASFVDLRLTRPPQSLKPSNDKGNLFAVSCHAIQYFNITF